MKVKELLEIIEMNKRSFFDFLEWDVALEHVENPEKDLNCKGDIIKSENFDDKCVFIKSHCMGCCTYFVEKKIFGIQIHY